ncbi:MAG: metallophosphoesterase family protein, partial [Halobacteria archaeon]|nr:metallophosphoesterase family protein [Halobacteria archaeon]
PETVGFEVEGVRFAVSHGTGPKRGYEDRVARVGKEKDADVSVAGHTHEVLDTTVEGVRLLNPGSCTGAPPATETTMMRVVVDEGEIEVETIRL